MAMFVRFEDGKITEGPIGDSVAPEGFVEYREVINIPPNAGDITATIALVDGICVKTITGQTSYVKQRQSAYPSLGDQMDMLWHAMDDEIIPRVEPFYTDILNIKAQYPKPPAA